MSERRHPPGISMIEITIVIGLLAALAGFLVTRLGRLQLDAERAAMQQVLQGVRSVLNLQVASWFASGRTRDLREFVGSNPMEQFSPPPASYVGRVRADDASWIRGGQWYFDEDDGLLIYRVQNEQYFECSLAGPPRARFKILGVNADGIRSAQFRSEGTKIQGLTVSAVEPFLWMDLERVEDQETP